MFDAPFWSGLWRQIVDPQLGLVRSAPQVLFALPGFAVLFRRARAEAVLVFACFAAQLAVFAPYRLWLASSYGHRFVLSAVVLCAMPVAALADRFLRPAAPA
jgi:hypothetical protein